MVGRVRMSRHVPGEREREREVAARARQTVPKRKREREGRTKSLLNVGLSAWDAGCS